MLIEDRRMTTYKRLGDYIREVNVRNRELKVTNLLGVSISKEFMPSIANTIGTDMSTYKIVEREQFAYGPVTSRNGDKVSIALLDGYDDAIISQAYTVFEVIDHEQLLPEYLMMWFRRPEFDRYARFHSHGSAREIFDWDELCDVMLPIPSITRQREIVSEYETLTNRIRLNEQMIQNLEATAQALYRKTFVDNIDKENLPEGWYITNLDELYNFQYGKGNNNPDNGGPYPIYGGGGVIGGYDEYNSENAPVIGHIGNCGALTFAYGKHFVTYNGIICNINDAKWRYFGYLTLKQFDLKSQSRGSTQPFISYDMLYELIFVMPPKRIIELFDEQVLPLYALVETKLKENSKISELQSLLLAKMGLLKQ